MPWEVRVPLITVAVVGLGWAIVYFVRFPQVRAHCRPIRAAVALMVGTGATLALVWSPGVEGALGKFVLSPGLGSVAALAAAALALFGVFRQLRARETERRADEERARADKYADHFRWVTERVMGSTRLEDISIVEFLVQDLFDRAPNGQDEAAAFALLELHVARLKERPAAVDVSSDG